MNRDATLRAWLDAHGSMIGRIAGSYERRPELVAELVQDTALALWRALASYRGDASEKTFVARIAHNVCVSHVRKAVRTPTTPWSDGLNESLPDQPPQPDEQVQSNERRTLLLRAVRSLPLSLRPVMTLHLEGFSNQDIAQSLSLSANNVGVRLNRAKAHITKQLGKSL